MCEQEIKIRLLICLLPHLKTTLFKNLKSFILANVLHTIHLYNRSK